MQPAPFGDPHTKERCPSCGVWKHKQRECSVCTKFPTRVQAAEAQARATSPPATRSMAATFLTAVRSSPSGRHRVAPSPPSGPRAPSPPLEALTRSPSASAFPNGESSPNHTGVMKHDEARLLAELVLAGRHTALRVALTAASQSSQPWTKEQKRIFKHLPNGPHDIWLGDALRELLDQGVAAHARLVADAVSGSASAREHAAAAESESEARLMDACMQFKDPNAERHVREAARAHMLRTSKEVQRLMKSAAALEAAAAAAQSTHTASLCSLAARLVAEKDAWLSISLGELSRAETGTLEGEDSIRKLQVECHGVLLGASECLRVPIVASDIRLEFACQMTVVELRSKLFVQEASQAEIAAEMAKLRLEILNISLKRDKETALLTLHLHLLAEELRVSTAECRSVPPSAAECR
jgi:hypothetical protein